MIKQIRIKDYKTCDNVRVLMNKPLMAIIGKNAVGKSNTLKGIYIAALQILSGEKPDDFQAPNGFSCEFIFGHKGSDYIYTIKVRGKKETYILDSLYQVKDNNKIEVFNKNRKVSMNVIGSSSPIFLPAETTGLSFISDIFLLKNDKIPSFIEHIHKHENIILIILVSLLRVKYYDFKDNSTLTPILTKEYEKWKANNSSIPIKKRLSCKYYDFYKNKNSDFLEFKSLLKSLGLVHDIYIYEPEEKEDDHSKPKSGFLYFPLFKINNNFHYFNELSDGTQRIILMLLYLLYDKPSLMLIEEPEISIHYGLLIKLLSIFSQYSFNSNILFTTHSEQLLNKLDPNQIIYLYLNNGVTNVKYVTGRNLNTIYKYLEDVGPLGEYVTSGEMESDFEN